MIYTSFTFVSSFDVNATLSLLGIPLSTRNRTPAENRMHMEILTCIRKMEPKVFINFNSDTCIRFLPNKYLSYYKNSDCQSHPSLVTWEL